MPYSHKAIVGTCRRSLKRAKAWMSSVKSTRDAQGARQHDPLIGHLLRTIGIRHVSHEVVTSSSSRRPLTTPIALEREDRQRRAQVAPRHLATPALGTRPRPTHRTSCLQLHVVSDCPHLTTAYSLTLGVGTERSLAERWRCQWGPRARAVPTQGRSQLAPRIDSTSARKRLSAGTLHTLTLRRR